MGLSFRLVAWAAANYSELVFSSQQRCAVIRAIAVTALDCICAPSFRTFSSMIRRLHPAQKDRR